MLRTIIISVLLLANAQLAAADDKTTNTLAVANASAAESTRPTKESTDTTGQRPKQSSIAAKAAGGPAVATVAANAADGTAGAAAAGNEAAAPSGDVKMSGISILGNEDAPKSLVLVPWKSSQLGDMPSVSRLLDATAQPVDKDVFMRELSYYQFKSGSSESGDSREPPVGK
jgi:hypothetical protein